jgi:hypothetical protein
MMKRLIEDDLHKEGHTNFLQEPTHLHGKNTPTHMSLPATWWLLSTVVSNHHTVVDHLNVRPATCSWSEGSHWQFQEKKKMQAVAFSEPVT